jgi:hypothetical protein
MYGQPVNQLKVQLWSMRSTRPCLGRNRIAGIAAILNVKLDGFAYVAQRFRAVVSWLTQPGNAGTLAT